MKRKRTEREKIELLIAVTNDQIDDAIKTIDAGRLAESELEDLKEEMQTYQNELKTLRSREIRKNRINKKDQS